MKVQIQIIGKNKETQEQEIYSMGMYPEDIACLYKDKYGVALTTLQGKFYRVNHELKELRELL